MRTISVAGAALSAVLTLAAAAAAGPGETEIFAVARNGSVLQRLTSGGQDRLPAVSPDGRQVAFVGLAASGDELSVMNRDGGARTILWRPERPAGGVFTRLGQPAWSPSGETILVPLIESADPRSPTTRLYLIRRSNGAALELGNWAGGYVSAAFSADGRYIAYRTVAANALFSGNERAGVYSATGADVASLPALAQAAWSPCSARLAYVPARGNRLTVAGPRGGNRWTFKLPISGGIAWSRDCKTIALVHDVGRTATLYLVRPGTQSARRLLALPRDPSGLPYTLSVAADGRWIAAAGGEAVLLVRNDGRDFRLLPNASTPAWSPQGATLPTSCRPVLRRRCGSGRNTST
jgi:Tol biopolymer transport system component